MDLQVHDNLGYMVGLIGTDGAHIYLASTSPTTVSTFLFGSASVVDSFTSKDSIAKMTFLNEWWPKWDLVDSGMGWDLFVAIKK